jgi:aspartate racemase
MKLIGLIGGTTWFSTSEYYKCLNELTAAKMGGSHSARLLLYSVNFNDFKPSTNIGDWIDIGERLSAIASILESAGAECLALCANTPHFVADTIQRAIKIPLLHIAEATALKIHHQNLKKVALLGTRVTMEQNFFRNKLAEFNIECIIPELEEREFIHQSILEELGKGIFTPATKVRYLDIMTKLYKQGAEGIIFGCTEIPLLIKAIEIPYPTFDTTLIHSEYIISHALS